MSVTRIKNNQITDLTVNAAAKLQDFSITSGKIANNLTYGSDLTIAGNLTVQGNVTAIDTTDLVVEDPLFLLAKDQTGSPALDIGFIGKRGTSDNIAWIWDEGAGAFAAVFTDSEITNTTVNILSYASVQFLDVEAANLDITGNIEFSGNIVGNVTVTGNIDADNFNATSAVTAGTTITATGNVAGGNVTTAGVVTATGNVTGGNITTAGEVVATGNVAGGNITTAGTVVATGNVTGGNITTAGSVDATGNVTGGNITTAGVVTATGNVTGGNITTAGAVDATGNVTGGNITTAGAVDATGNVTGGNITTAGAVDATGNVAGGNITTAGSVDATGNVSGGNLVTAGNVDGANINATANVTGTGAVFSGNVTADTFIGNISGNIDAGGANTEIQFNDDDVLAGSAAFTFDKTSNVVTASGNIAAGNLVTGGVVDATGNVTGGNITTAGSVAATGNVTGGNITTAGNIDGANVNATAGITAGTTVVATGNVAGGNITTAGVVTATGNVSGGNLNTGGVVSATGNVSGGNITTAGNVDAANVNATTNVTATTVTASGNVDAATAVNANLIAGTSVQIDSTGDIVLNPTGNINVSGVRIRNMSDPELAFDAATKQYVDDAVSAGLHIHPPVDVETPVALPTSTYANGGNTFTVNETIAGNTVVFTTAANLQVNDQLWFSNSFNGVVGNLAYFVVSTPNTSAAVLTTAYNGVPVSNITSGSGLTESVRVNSGVGATLTATANAALVIDGLSVSAGNRVLVYNQSNQIENGVYDVTDAGNVSAPWILTRSSDADTYEPNTSTGLDDGSYFYVRYGDTGAGESYVKTAPAGPFIFGVANIEFTQFSASQVYSANTSAGLSLTGTVFSAKVDNDTTAFDGGGNIIVKASANLVTPNIGDATGNSLTLGGNGLLSATSVTATGNVSGGNITTTGDVTTVTVTASGNVSGANVNATAGVTAGTTVTATGNVAGGNITTAGVVTATGNVTGGNITTAGVVTATGNVSGGNITTAGNIDGANVNATGTVAATGNVTGGNLNTGGAVDATGNVSGGNITTAGAVDATGNVTGGNLVTAGTVVATGNVAGGNITTAGSVDATGNITGGNISAGSGTIVTTGNIDGANINATANVTGQGAVFSGNVTADTFIGNISGNIDAGGANTQIQFNDDDVLAGSAAFTFDKTSNAVVATGNITGANFDTAGVIVATGNITGGNVDTGGTVIATGNVTGGNLTTAGVVTATGNVSGGNITTAGAVDATGNVSGANITTAGAVDATGNVTGGNLVTTGTADLGNIRITGDDITNFASNTITFNSAASDIDVRFSGDTVANLLVTDAGTDTVLIGTGTPSSGAALKIGTTDSMIPPVGNLAQRPGTPVVGMFRFSTTEDALEVYTSGEGWQKVGAADFTVITADEFTGDGSTLVFTLSTVSTTAATIVSINGVVQQPVTAYAVSGNVLTFTEAPLSSDVIDARVLTTTTTVTSIENVSGNAKVETVDTADTVEITGNLLPVTSNTYNLGSSSLRWNELFLEGSTITLGNIVIKNTTGNTIGFFGPDGTTPATLDSNVEVVGDAIESGTSNVSFAGANGNVLLVSGGNTTGVITGTGANVAGYVTASGNITGGNIITAGLVSLSSITKTGSNGAGNIGSSDSTFDTIFAKATSAQYADLAEMYEADALYLPGTVLCFGGDKEVTVCNQSDCVRVAGVVSTNPSYLMNSGQTGEYVAAVALQGRVPCRVTGSIRKGDLMVSTGDGRARANNAARVGTVIGKAIADFDGADGVIEVVVGRI